MGEPTRERTICTSNAQRFKAFAKLMACRHSRNWNSNRMNHQANLTITSVSVKMEESVWLLRTVFSQLALVTLGIQQEWEQEMSKINCAQLKGTSSAVLYS